MRWGGWADVVPEVWADADGWGESGGAVMREVMDVAYRDADDEAYDEALESVLDELSAAEAIEFTRALQQIQRGAAQVARDPLVGQIAGTVLPVGAGALGTLIGGPVGTAIGSNLGTAAAGALTRAGRPPTPAVTASPVAGGSAAAAQGAVLAGHPDVTKALLALAMGQHGARQVGGIPVASVMNLLSSVFGQAAADADELAYLDRAGDTAAESDDADAGESLGRSLYVTLMDADNEELAS